jgi:hypothetical protein
VARSYSDRFLGRSGASTKHLSLRFLGEATGRRSLIQGNQPLPIGDNGMDTAAIQTVAEARPDLLYIEIGAVAAVALVIVTCIMIGFQIRAANTIAKVQLTMGLMDRKDSLEIRNYRRAIATDLRAKNIPLSSVVEPLLDHFETVALLRAHKWLEPDLAENGFANSMRFWWHALGPHVLQMRKTFDNKELYDRFEESAKAYERKASSKPGQGPVTEKTFKDFLESEMS